jgi:hypothetical protein
MFSQLLTVDRKKQMRYAKATNFVTGSDDSSDTGRITNEHSSGALSGDTDEQMLFWRKRFRLQ